MVGIRTHQSGTPSPTGATLPEGLELKAEETHASRRQLMVVEPLPSKFVQAPSTEVQTPDTANAAERQAADRTPLQVLRAVLQDGPKNPTAAELKADLEAHEIMRRAVRDNDEQMRADVVGYAQSIGAKVDQGTPLTIHEHTAVTYLLRCGMFDAPDAATASPEIVAADQKFNDEVRGSLSKSLAASWKNLTGKERAPDKLLTRLPKMVLRKASRKARVYHAAAFIPMTADRAVRLKASSMFRDYVPENHDVLLGTGALLASVFTSAGRWAVGSTILQYVMYSVTENVLHDHLAHPKGRMGEWFQKGPGPNAGWLQRAVHRVLGKFMKKQVDVTAKAHDGLHHRWTFRESFTQMFDAKVTQERVNDMLDKHFTPEMAEKLKEEHYATALQSDGMAKIFSTIVPQTAVYIAAGALLGAPAWLLVPTIIMAAAYPVAMGKGHPIYHVSVSEARETASDFMKKLRETRYISYSARNHWMHHHYPDANFNLSYPGADALLGQLMQPNLDDLFQMAEDDVLHY